MTQDALDGLSSTDRGFLTWVAQIARRPLAELWEALRPTCELTADGRRLAVLDLSPLGAALRDGSGGRRLSLPLGGLRVHTLDVTGLQLDELDVRPLPDLEILRCADNRIAALDLSQCPGLRRLDASGNRLMLLELATCGRLEAVAACGNGLAVATLPSSAPTLDHLDLSRNQLMVLELGALPALRTLNLYRNALARFVLASAPALEHLDLGRNELDALPLPPLPACRWLSVSRNQLDKLDLRGLPDLRDLKCHGNYLDALDLTPCRGLRRLEARSNQLRMLATPARAALEEVDLSDNRLVSAPLDAPDLQVLRLSGNELRTFATDGTPALRVLDVTDNELGSLAIGGSPGLVELRCSGNPLPRLDLRGNPALVRFVSRAEGEGPEVAATDPQRHRLRELRELHGLGTGALDPARMDAWELHDLAAALHGRDADPRLLQIVTAPACDLGTALLVYWTSSPHYFTRYAARDEVAEFEAAGWDLLAAIEKRVAEGGYRTAEIPFDPRDDHSTRDPRGVDWTAEPRAGAELARRPIPAYMHRAVAAP